MITHICSLKNTATIVQQEASNFNVAHRYSCQKRSLTILHEEERCILTTHVHYSGANKSIRQC